MKNIFYIVFIYIQIHWMDVNAQVNFNESNFEIEVNEDITTYLFVDNIEKPTIDLGSEFIIGEIKEIRTNYYLIKLKAVQKISKPTSMLIIDKGGKDIPIFIIKYNQTMKVGKYLYDAKINKFQNTNNSSLKSNITTNDENNQSIVLDSSTVKLKSKYESEFNSQKKEFKIYDAKVTLDKSENTLKVSQSNKFNNKLKFLRDKETFISGLNTSHYLIELTSFAKSKEDKKIYYLVKVLNKTVEFQVDDVVIEIKRKVKSRGDVSDIVADIEFSDKFIKPGESYFIISSPEYSIDNNESVIITISEKTDYGTGKKMELSIRYKDFTKIKIIP